MQLAQPSEATTFNVSEGDGEIAPTALSPSPWGSQHSGEGRHVKKNGDKPGVTEVGGETPRVLTQPEVRGRLPKGTVLKPWLGTVLYKEGRTA